MLLRVLYRPQSLLSRAANDQEPESEPQSDDERFARRVVELEDHRSRPAARGGAPQLMRHHLPVRRVVDRPWEEDVSGASWSRQPRGVTSEWFPLR